MKFNELKFFDSELPKYEIMKEGMKSELTYNLIKTELMDEGNSRMNLATFCQTNMETNTIK